MVNFASILVSGLIMSALYALVSLGFTLIVSLRGVVNLAYGGFFLISAYTYFTLVAQQGLDTLLSFGVAVLVAAVASLVLYLALVRYIEHDEEQTFIATFLVAFILQELFTYQFGSPDQLLTDPFDGVVDVLGIAVSYTQIAALVSATVIIGLFILFINYTRTGRAIIAMSLDEVGANLVGVNTARVNYVTWLISGAMAGVAGLFLGLFFSASPTMWLDPLLIAFAIVIVGGIGSIKGTIVAALLIGYVQTITVTVWSPSWRGVFAYAILIAIIMVRPQGLFGREVLE